eukprot:5072793-Lingulodinium_polyedra.AAC.1
MTDDEGNAAGGDNDGVDNDNNAQRADEHHNDQMADGNGTADHNDGHIEDDNGNNSNDVMLMFCDCDKNGADQTHDDNAAADTDVDA